MSFGFIPESFRLVPAYSGLFRFICVIPPHSGVIPVSFRLVSVYSGTILVHSVSFRCHSGVIPPHSGIFRFIPVYSVPFRSVPVFSNALELVPDRLNFFVEIEVI